MSETFRLVQPELVPPLDPEFRPAALANRAFRQEVGAAGVPLIFGSYEGEGDDIAAHMLEPHMNDVSPISWDEVYADWKTDDLKYYWRKVKHRAVPRDMGYIEKGFSEAVDLARQRDDRGVLALRRVVRPHEDAPQIAVEPRADVPQLVLPDWLGKRPPVEGDWVPTLNEEFDGNAIDLHRWNVYGPNWWDKRMHFSKDNVIVRDGMLTLRIPKKEAATPRQITVKAA